MNNVVNKYYLNEEDNIKKVFAIIILQSKTTIFYKFEIN